MQQIVTASSTDTRPAGVPRALGRAAGIAFGGAVGYLGFSRAAHAAQEWAFDHASPVVDVAAGLVGGALGVRMGDALSDQNPQKSFGLFCGLLAASFAPHVLHALYPVAQPDGGLAALAPPAAEIHHYHHMVLPAL